MEVITAWLTVKVAAWAGGALLALILGWLAPNEKFTKTVEKLFYGLGIACTLGASKKLKIWNKIIEPWFVDLLDNLVGAAVRGFIRGLRSDNKES